MLAQNKMPEYHLRLVSENEAKIFKIAYNNQKRITWSYFADISLSTAKITAKKTDNIPESLDIFCTEALAELERTKKTNQTAFDTLKHIGKLAEALSAAEFGISQPLFELLIWAEADLRNNLISSKGLEKMEDDVQEKFILAGNKFLSEGKPQEAEEQFLLAQKLGGNEANLNNFLAIALFDQGKKSEAAKTIDLAIQKSKKNLNFRLRGIQFHLSIDNKAKALEYITKIDVESIDDFELMLQVSRLALRAGNAALSYELALAVVENTPSDEQSFEHLINAAVSAKGQEAVFALMQKKFDSLPKPPRLRQWWLRMLIEEGHLDLAESDAKTWVEADPDAFQGWFQLGRIHLAKENPRRALRSLKRATGLNEKNAAAFKLIADACIALGDFAEASEASLKACQLDPSNANFSRQSEWIAKQH